MKTALPFLLINMAMSADGKIATTNRAINTFGSSRDHRHLLELRTTVDAVMAGARTVDQAPITMSSSAHWFRQARRRAGLAEHPLRILVSGKGTVSTQAKVFADRSSPIVILTTDRAGARRRRALASMADEVHVCGGQTIDFRAALRWLRQKWGVKRLLGEGGSELNDALFRAGVVGELHLTVCPYLVGGREAPTIVDGRGFTTLKEAVTFRLKSRRRCGREMFLVYDVEI